MRSAPPTPTKEEYDKTPAIGRGATLLIAPPAVFTIVDLNTNIMHTDNTDTHHAHTDTHMRTILIVAKSLMTNIHGESERT